MLYNLKDVKAGNLVKIVKIDGEINEIYRLNEVGLKTDDIYLVVISGKLVLLKDYYTGTKFMVRNKKLNIECELL